MSTVTERASATSNELAAWFSRNRLGVGLAGAAAVALLALTARRRAATSDAPAGGVMVGDPQQFRGYGPYDSTPNDVYNALQAQIEGSWGEIADLLADRLKTPPPAPRPAPPVRAFPSPLPPGVTRLAPTPNRPRVSVPYPIGWYYPFSPIGTTTATGSR